MHEVEGIKSFWVSSCGHKFCSSPGWRVLCTTRIDGLLASHGEQQVVSSVLRTQRDLLIRTWHNVTRESSRLIETCR